MRDSSATPEKRAQFVALLSDYGNVSRAAEEAELNRAYLYRLKSEDEAFSAAWDEAARVGAARLEDEARRRAVEGWQEPVWYQGDQVGTVRKYSDTLLICLLKAHHPEKYADRQKNDTTIKGELGVSLDILSPALNSSIAHLLDPEDAK